jgi:hypothetical protein
VEPIPDEPVETMVVGVEPVLPVKSFPNLRHYVMRAKSSFFGKVKETNL